MSEGKKIERASALALAQEMMGHLNGVCLRVEMAGSLRRNKPMVGDIEICCVPRQSVDLFGEKDYLWGDVRDALAMFKIIKGGEHYQQYDLGICKADVFVTSLEQWGVIYTIRTGSAEFSRKLVTPKTYGGFMPRDMCVREGRLWLGSVSIETLEEADLFKAIGLGWVPPDKR